MLQLLQMYVDDLNPMGTLEELIKLLFFLKKELEIKDLGKIFCLGWQIKKFSKGMLVHQLIYTEKVLNHFHIN